MATLESQPTNQRQLDTFRRTVSEMLAYVLAHGFYGAAGVEMTLQNGIIQNVLMRIERVEK